MASNTACFFCRSRPWDPTWPGGRLCDRKQSITDLSLIPHLLLFFLPPNKQWWWGNEAPGCCEDMRWEGDLATQNVENEKTQGTGCLIRELWTMVATIHSSANDCFATHAHTLTHELIKTVPLMAHDSAALKTCRTAEDTFQLSGRFSKILILLFNGWKTHKKEELRKLELPGGLTTTQKYDHEETTVDNSTVGYKKEK